MTFSPTSTLQDSPRLTDPELTRLPEPRRPWRRLTLFTLSITALLSVWLGASLFVDLRYAFRGGPVDLGELSGRTLSPELAGAWVRGEAALEPEGAVSYGRPLERDTYRLAKVAGSDHLWVQIRVPEGMEGPHFVPPTSFVGRLMPASNTGLRYAGLSSALEASSAAEPNEAWLLIDGEAPGTTRWVSAMVALFFAFAAFNVYGLAQLLRPAKT
jgi:hypothetical protein